MKESQNLIQYHHTDNLTDKSQEGQNKSNISSLKAILSTATSYFRSRKSTIGTVY